MIIKEKKEWFCQVVELKSKTTLRIQDWKEEEVPDLE